MLSPDEWANALRAEGYSLYTVRAYHWHVQRLLKFLKKEILEITTRDLNAYLAERRDAGWADATVKMSVNAMQSFFGRSLGKRKSPARSLKAPVPKMKPQRTLTAEQAVAVIASCETTTARGQRDLALLCLMLDTGLRSLEVCRLELERVNLGERRLMALVKGARWQPKVFSVYTASQIERWLAVRASLARPEALTLFVSVGGNTTGAPLTVYGLRVIFRRIAHRAGLERFSPHDLRRSFATLTIKFGASTRIVQQQGGWEDLTLLERYTQALKVEDVAPYLPIDRLMGV